jgi:predicted small metal-binding protein
MNKMYQIDCEPMCGFSVKSHDKSEAKKYAKEHVQMVHSKMVSDGEVEKMVREV